MEGEFVEILCSEAVRAGIRARDLQILAGVARGDTLETAGRRYGISRQRVWQILVEIGRRVGPVMYLCPVCWTVQLKPLAGRPCPACRAEMRKKTRRCAACGAPLGHSNGHLSYCSRCRYETRSCAACGRPITRDRGRQSSYFRHGLWFCNRVCLGRWLGNHRGFASRAGRNGEGR